MKQADVMPVAEDPGVAAAQEEVLALRVISTNHLDLLFNKNKKNLSLIF